MSDDIKAAKAIFANLPTAPKNPTPLALAMAQRMFRSLPDEHAMAWFAMGWQAAVECEVLTDDDE